MSRLHIIIVSESPKALLKNTVAASRAGSVSDRSSNRFLFACRCKSG